MRPRRLSVAAAVLLVGSGLAACADDDSDPTPASAEPSPTVSDSSATSSQASSGSPTGGTADSPTALEATSDPMEWVPAPGSVKSTVTTNGTWFLTVDSSGTTYALDGPEQSLGSGADDNTRITNALLDKDWAVVVRQDQGDKKAATAQVTELGSGEQFTLGGDSEVPTTNGGTWALGGDTLVHATVSPQGDYCVATVDLPTRKATLGWCAKPRHGFNSAHVTAAGTALMTFDDSSPSCRTVATVDGTRLEPFPGVAACKGWEGAVLGADASVWSVIPKENRIEEAEFYARNGDAYFDLGPGTSGTLVPCAGAAYFVRDPQKEGEPAKLLRWDGSSLAAVYEAPPGLSFLDAPRCGDNAIVVTALSEGGDEQVMAALN